MRRTVPPPIKHVYEARVRMSEEALEGCNLLLNYDSRVQTKGFQVSGLGETPEEAARAVKTALRRLGAECIRQAQLIYPTPMPVFAHDYTREQLLDMGCDPADIDKMYATFEDIGG